MSLPLRDLLALNSGYSSTLAVPAVHVVSVSAPHSVIPLAERVLFLATRPRRKPQAKKHKTWESDGILVVENGTKVSLRDKDNSSMCVPEWRTFDRATGRD
jgi:hypothetical protein